jgi:PAS domain S-box-containing protein
VAASTAPSRKTIPAESGANGAPQPSFPPPATEPVGASSATLQSQYRRNFRILVALLATTLLALLVISILKLFEGELLLSNSGKRIEVAATLLGLAVAIAATVVAINRGIRLGLRLLEEIERRTMAEAALLQLSREKALILNSAGEGICGLDANGRANFLNPAAAAMLGRPAEEMLGLGVHEIVHHSQGNGAPYPIGLCPILATVRNGAVNCVDTEVFWRRDGSCFPVEYVSTPVRDEAGALAGAVVTFRDISERVAAQERLREAEEKYRTLFEDSRDAIYIVGPDGRFLEANQAALDLLGYTRQELLRLPAAQTYANPADREFFLRELHQKGSVHDCELRLRRKGGSEIIVLDTATLWRSSGGAIRGLCGILRDITERKRAEEALRRLGRQHELILNAVAEGIYGEDLQGKTTFVNRAAARILGWEAQELLGRPMHDVLHYGNHSRLSGSEESCSLRRNLSNGTPRCGEDVFWRNDGACFPVEYTSTPVRDEQGAIAGAVVTFRDITESKQAQEQLQAALRMQSGFVSFASHQLRTPLSAIKWLLELALQHPTLDQEVRSYVDDARQSAERLIRLVSDLLDVSRLESGRMRLAPAKLALSEITSTVLQEMVPLIHEKQQLVQVNQGAEPGPVRIDPQLCRQLLINLVSNAIKFTPQGGSIRIEIGEQDGSALWAIEDTGAGIPKAAQERLFQKFFRADNAFSLQTEGNGLGLYFARLVLEKSGGKIWCESDEGKGASFFFTLPLAKE